VIKITVYSNDIQKFNFKKHTFNDYEKFIKDVIVLTINQRKERDNDDLQKINN